MSDISRVKLSDRIERQRVKRGLEVELSDGSVVLVDPPELWSEAASKTNADPKKTDEDLAIALMGKDAWVQFKADGGTPRLFADMLNEHYRSTQAATVGESSASSSS